MNGQEAIIAEILQTAEKSAAALLDAARAEKEATLRAVRDEEEHKQNAALDEARQNAAAILARGKTLNGLQARKTTLAAKQRMIDEAFAEAVRKMHNMTDHIYRDYIGALIKEYADDGDSVIVAACDKKRLHAEWLQSVSEKCGKKLTLSEKTHGGEGGVILSGDVCDKNLTLETLFADLKEKYLSAVAKRLFG